MGVGIAGIKTVMAKPSSKKLCYLCGHSLPLYSKATGRLCVICRRCPTCGSRKIESDSQNKVECGDCGNTWDSIKTMERETISCHKTKCSQCNELIPYLVLQTHAHLCEDHFKCPNCSKDDLVMSFPSRRSEVKVAYQCDSCGWTGSPRHLERKLQAKNPLK